MDEMKITAPESCSIDFLKDLKAAVARFQSVPDVGSLQNRGRRAIAHVCLMIAWKAMSDFFHDSHPDWSGQEDLFEVPEHRAMTLRELHDFFDRVRDHALGAVAVVNGEDGGSDEGPGQSPALVQSLAIQISEAVTEAEEITFDDLGAILGAPDKLRETVELLVHLGHLGREDAEGVETLTTTPLTGEHAVDYDAMLERFPQLGTADADPESWWVLLTTEHLVERLLADIKAAGAHGMSWADIVDALGLEWPRPEVTNALQSRPDVFSLERDVTGENGKTEPQTFFVSIPLEEMEEDDLRNVYQTMTGEEPGRKQRKTLIKAIQAIMAEQSEA